MIRAFITIWSRTGQKLGSNPYEIYFYMNCSLPVKLTYDGKYFILDLRPLLNGKASPKLKNVNVH